MHKMHDRLVWDVVGAFCSKLGYYRCVAHLVWKIPTQFRAKINFLWGKCRLNLMCFVLAWFLVSPFPGLAFGNQFNLKKLPTNSFHGVWKCLESHMRASFSGFKSIMWVGKKSDSGLKTWYCNYFNLVLKNRKENEKEWCCQNKGSSWM